MNWLARSFFIADVIFGLEANGQTSNPGVPPGLPESLPMFANTNQMYEWVATNQPVYPVMVLFYTANDGSPWKIQYGLVVRTNFASYGAYKDFFVSSMLEFVSTAIATNADPYGPAAVRANLTIDGGPYVMSQIQVSNTSLCNITSNWLIGLSPTGILPQVSVPGLQQFTIQVYGLYTNAWNGSSWMPVIPPYPREGTGTVPGWIVLNSWYCLLGRTNEARFGVTAGGSTQVYTQTGAPLLPSVLSMADSTHLQVAMTSGSDTTIQFTDDLASAWQTLAVTAWSNNTGTVVYPLNPAVSGRQFFRAFSQ
jgi:hypothetical protein